jgi:hypothetical protein
MINLLSLHFSKQKYYMSLINLVYRTLRNKQLTYHIILTFVLEFNFSFLNRHVEFAQFDHFPQFEFLFLSFICYLGYEL